MRQRVVAGLEFIGGCFGLVMLFFATRVGPTSANGFAVLALTVAIYLLALAAGILLWRGQKAGRVLSIGVQLIQLPKLLFSKFAFMMSFGFDVFPVVVLDKSANGISLSAKIGAFDLIRVGDVGMPWLVGISITSCLSLYALLSDEEMASANRYATYAFWILAGSALALFGSFLAVSQLRRGTLTGTGIAIVLFAACGVASVVGFKMLRKWRSRA